MIRVGFIGVGNISRSHLRYLSTRDDVSISALCDTDESILAERTAQYGGTGYRDFHRMLDRSDLDAVWLCTPTRVRRDPLTACAKRGWIFRRRRPTKRGGIACALGRA